ncbi:MAG: hypothetical protein ACLFR7_11095 [Opitutales bacterium]
MAEATRRELFLPSWWAWLVAGAGALFLHALLLGMPAAGWTTEATFLLLLGLVGLFGSVFFTTILWWWSDGARGVFQGVFLGVWGSFLLVLFIQAREAQYAHDVALVEQIEETRLALRQQAADRARQALAEMQDRRERMQTDRFARYEGQVPPEVLERMRAADAEVLAELEAAADRYASVIAANELEGPPAWLRVATLDQLEDLRARNEAVYEASRAYNDFLDGLEERYTARLEAMDLPPPADRFALAEKTRLLQYWEYSGAREIRRLDAEITGIALRALDLLRDHWGEWTFDRSDSRVRFDTPGLEFRFSQLLNEAQMLTRQQRQLVRDREEFDEGRQPASGGGRAPPSEP